MTQPSQSGNGQRPVSEALIQTLIRQPHTLQATLEEAGLTPHELAAWARQKGDVPEIEKVAGWLSVGHQPGRYQPLLEVAAGHLRANELLEALPVFRWAYRVWQNEGKGQPGYRYDGTHRYDGCKLLALWGECLYRLGVPEEALERWLWALALVPDGATLARLARTIERAGATEAYEAVLTEARRRRLPEIHDLRQRRQLPTTVAETEILPLTDDPAPNPKSKTGNGKSVAVMADVANLDMVCHDQFGYDKRLDYGRLLRIAERHGPVQAKIAFVPDIPETLAVRRHLTQAGFDIDLKRPKRSHGRLVANADTAMAAAAVRWASDPQVGRVELWTGDGDFLKVREVVDQTWPEVTVAFRSFEVGTAAAIQRLRGNWMSIGPEYLRA